MPHIQSPQSIRNSCPLPQRRGQSLEHRRIPMKNPRFLLAALSAFSAFLLLPNPAAFAQAPAQAAPHALAGIPGSQIDSSGGISLQGAMTSKTRISAPTIEGSVNSVLNVKSLPSAASAVNARGDGAMFSIPAANAPLRQGSNVLSCGAGSNCRFQPSDAGKLLCVGPQWSRQNPGAPQELCTTITAVASATSITLADAWPYSGVIASGAYLGVYATDDWAALNAVLNGGKTQQVFFPCGVYGFSKSLTVGLKPGVNPRVIMGASTGGCVVLWYMGGGPSGTPPSAWTGFVDGKMESLRYALFLQSAGDVENLVIHGNNNVQEVVLDQASGTRSNIAAVESTDYAYMLVGSVSWSGRDVAVILQPQQIIPQINGIRTSGSRDGAGPNTCVSCISSENVGIGIYQGWGGMNLVSLQASGNGTNAVIVHGGHLAAQNSLFEYIHNQGEQGLVDIYGEAHFYNVGIGPAVTVEAGGELFSNSSAIGTPLTIKPASGGRPAGQVHIVSGSLPVAHNLVFDSSRVEDIQNVTDSNTVNTAAGWNSVRARNNFDADTYTEIYGDWEMQATCANYAFRPCRVFALMPKALHPGAHWRAVFRGQWTVGNGVMLTTVPEAFELSPTDNVIHLGGNVVVTVVENTNPAYAHPGQLVMYVAGGIPLQFTGSIDVYPNTSPTQPTVSYQSVVARSILSSAGPQQLARNIALSGWGAGAAVSSVSGYEQRFRFTIVAGASPSANPTFAATLPGPLPATPLCEAQQVGGSGQHSYLNSGAETATNTGVITWAGTPSPRASYVIQVDCR